MNKLKVKVRKSDTHGKGIFVTQDIKKGKSIFKVQGKKIKFLINNPAQAKKAGMNWVGYGANTWINPTKFSVYLNHSCGPSAFIRNRNTVVARRNIKSGGEVTIDYSLNEGDIFWKMPCHCGAKNCRKVIRSIQSLPKSFIRKQKKYIPAYYQKVYQKFNAGNFKNSKEQRSAWVSFLTKSFKV
jgi:uncharacterized protein